MNDYPRKHYASPLSEFWHRMQDPAYQDKVLERYNDYMEPEEVEE